MKTFIEWLEINEAGFFSGLFGGKKTPPQNTNQETPEEKERKRQADVHNDVMRMLTSGNPSEASPSQPAPAPKIR